MTRVSILMLGGTLAALTLVVGCSDDEPEATETTAPTATAAMGTEMATATATETSAATEAPTATQAPTETAAPEGPLVQAQIAGFSLPEVVANVGDTVVWTNQDDAPHTVTAQDGSFSGSLGGGGEFRHTFTAAGEFIYICTVHEGMESTVTVQ
jgi:plastocyanin